MTGTLAQLISLISFGNEFLTRSTAFEYYPSNSTFNYCNLVDFRSFKKRFFFSKLKENVVAKNPTQWFELLRKDGCEKIRLHYQSSENKSMSPDYKLAAFVGGGGNWLLETIYNNHSDYWANRWEVTRQNAEDRKIWSVNYGRVLTNQPTCNISFEIIKARHSLETVLEEIKDFALKQELSSWAGVFDKAKQTMLSQNPHLDYYHKDLIVNKNYSLIAQQTLFSAGSAWVFGGMGSWNDLYFDKKEDQSLYEDLSKRLYDAIIQAILAAVNTVEI